MQLALVCGARTATAAVVTNIYDSLDGKPIAAAPVTLSRIGAPGDFARGVTPRVGGHKLPAQVNVLRRNADGSIRHALVSFVAPAGENLRVEWLNEGPAGPPPFAKAWGERARDLKLTLAPVEGGTLTSDLGRFFRGEAKTGGRVRLVHGGPVMREFELRDVPVDATGKPDPYIEIYWRLRVFSGQKSARVAAVVENCKPWSKGSVFKPVYPFKGVKLTAGDATRFEHGPYQHLDRTRYRIVAWTHGPLENLHRRPNFNYWVKGHFVPRYRQTVPLSVPQVDRTYAKSWEMRDGPAGERILGPGIIYKHMPGTGGRWDIGPYPAWTVAYLLTGSPRLYQSILHADGNGGGAFYIHERERPGVPGFDVAKQVRPPRYGRQMPPRRVTGVQPDNAHTPSIGYIAYLLTGDTYYAEEASFWASYHLGFWPHKGLSIRTTERGQAWGLRQITDAAFILPADHPLQPYFQRHVEKYLDDFDRTFVQSARRLHFTRDQFRNSGRKHWVNCNRNSTWQYAWLVWSLHNAALKGFPKAAVVRDWAADYILGFYVSGDTFTGPYGEVYRYDPRDANAYSTATALLETRRVQGRNGKPTVEVVRKIKDLDNYGEVWYYTKLNQDNAWTDQTGVLTRPDAQGDWPLKPDGWGHSRGHYTWHRYGSWIALVAAVEAGVPKADAAWSVMTRLAGKKSSYGFEMVPRNVSR